MDGSRLGENEGREKEVHTDESQKGLPASGRDSESRLRPMTIREAIEVMKMLAPIAPKITQAENAPAMIRIIMDHFSEVDPTMTLRIMSLMYHEPIETLVSTLEDKSSADFFTMLVEGFVVNSLADLIEGIYVLGMTRKVVDNA